MPVISHIQRIPSLPVHYPVIEWSDDNFVSVTCEDGLRIMRPNVTASMNSTDTLTWDIFFIPAEDCQSDKDVGVNRQKVYDQVTTEQSQLLALDPAIPWTETNNSGVSKPTYHRFGTWSPSGVDHLSRSVLATVDLNHNLCIWRQDHQMKNWKKTDLSGMLLDIMMKTDFPHVSIEKESDFARLRSRSYFLAAQQICWSHVFHGSTLNMLNTSNVYLFQLTKSNHIIIWKVRCESVEAEMVTTVQTDLNLGTAMHWCRLNSKEGYLVIGDSDGLLQAYLFSQEKEMASPSQFFLWKDMDHIQPKYFNWCEQGKIIVYAKGPHLCAQKVSSSSGKPDIAGFNLMLSGSVPISGITLQKTEVYVALADGQNISLHLDIESGVPSQMKQLESSGKEENMKYKHHGICYSKNGALLLSAHSPSIMYDHLALRKPLKIILQSCVELNEACKAVIERGNLCDSWDFLLIIKEGVRQELPLAAIVEVNLTQKEKWKQKPVIWLKLMRYVRLLQQSYKCTLDSRSKEKKPIPQMDDIQSDIEQLSFLIFKSHSASLLDGRKDIKSDKAALIRKLYSCIKESPDYSLSNTKEESCAICEEPVEYISVLHGSCRNGHRFGRCCQTLLLCQEIPYRKCSVCNSLALSFQDADADILQFQSNKCAFCDGILI